MITRKYGWWVGLVCGVQMMLTMPVAADCVPDGNGNCPCYENRGLLLNYCPPYCQTVNGPTEVSGLWKTPNMDLTIVIHRYEGESQTLVEKRTTKSSAVPTQTSCGSSGGCAVMSTTYAFREFFNLAPGVYDVYVYRKDNSCAYAKPVDDLCFERSNFCDVLGSGLTGTCGTGQRGAAFVLN